MKIGIIGAGNIGVGLERHLAGKNHDIVVAFARSRDKLHAAAQAIGAGARPGSPAEAAAHGEVVILATPWVVSLQVVHEIATMLRGKIVWDATNPLNGDMSGLEIGTTTSGGEEIAKAAPGAKIVKAVPPFAEVLNSASNLIDNRRPGVFVCGDDAAARRRVLELIEAIDADGVDAGPLALARYTEPLGMLLVQLAYVTGFGSRLGAVLIREASPAPGGGA